MHAINCIGRRRNDYTHTHTHRSGTFVMRANKTHTLPTPCTHRRAQRIMDSAEQAALSESEHDGGPGAPQSLTTKRHYESASGTVYQPSPHYDRLRPDYADGDDDDSDFGGGGGGGFRSAKRKRDVSAVEQRAQRRFDREPVDLGHSGILVPAGVDVADPDYQSAISWSAHLDPLFTNNLEGDAALSWQYFGSSSGFLRRYPGTGWPLEQARESRPVHDFRTDDWFVQAASSPKDIVSGILQHQVRLATTPN